jgi:hypothetical protein
MLWLIDTGGRVLRVTALLQAHFGTRLPATEFADFLARNLGWICVAVGKTRYEVRFRPGKVHDAALAAVADKLRRASAQRYRIAQFCGGWREEEFASATEAITRVMALADGARAAARAGDFVQSGRRRQDLTATDPLRLLVEAWSSGMRGAEMLATVANELLNGRFIVAEADGASDDLCIMAQGRDFNLIGQNWLSRVPRLRIADWPDITYGRWVEQSYRRAWQSAEPLIDDLDCIIQWPQLGRRRHRYTRLILPCRSASGSRRLLGAMRFDGNIDLRAQVQ